MDEWEGMAELRRLQSDLATIRKQMEPVDERVKEVRGRAHDIGQEAIAVQSAAQNLDRQQINLATSVGELDAQLVAFMKAVQAVIEDDQWEKVVGVFRQTLSEQPGEDISR